MVARLAVTLVIQTPLLVTLVAWGYDADGQTDVPIGLSNVIAIAAWEHNLALKNDGTVAAWGWNRWGQTNVPAGLSDVIAVAAGDRHSLALRRDGTVVGWGDNICCTTTTWQGRRPRFSVPATPTTDA